jgi:hypothetical protein
MNPGNKYVVNNVDVIALDIIDGNPLVLAYNIDMKAKFDDNSSNYSYSNLKSKCIEWLRKKDIEVVSRKIDLTALNGYKYFAVPTLSEIAPLTLDEYRKYVDIINPIIKQNFWLSTA